MGIFKEERVWEIVYEMLWKDLVVDNGMLNVGIDNKSKWKVGYTRLSVGHRVQIIMGMCTQHLVKEELPAV